ncbi:MAG: peptidyl-prolyl cis-trans isomerase [Armatimonadetes bacterium]|nr:peptidyl-prolyl cis-trans isomerase [Armatimonadota bacterium]
MEHEVALMGFVKKSLVLSLALLASGALAQVDANRVIVRVNGHPIFGREYYLRTEVLPNLGQVDSNRRFVQLYPGYLSLRWLIEEELIVQLAMDRVVEPSAQDVDEELKARMEREPEQVRSMLKLGFDENDLRRRVLVDLSEFNLLTQGITVTDFEVEKQYEDNLNMYTLQKRYDLSMIRVKGDEAKKAVDDALAAGDDFGKVASEHSIDISKVNAGKIGIVPDGALDPSTRTVLVDTRKGQVSAWVQEGDVFAKFLVQDVRDVEILPLDDDLKTSIRRALMSDRGRVVNNMPKMMADFRRTVILDFENYPFADDIKQYFKAGG